MFPIDQLISLRLSYDSRESKALTSSREDETREGRGKSTADEEVDSEYEYRESKRESS